MELKIWAAMLAPQMQKNILLFLPLSVALFSWYFHTSFIVPLQPMLKLPKKGKLSHCSASNNSSSLCKLSYRFCKNSLKMASTSTQKASSVTISHTYDVFLSFRGEDTRKNFTDHLYKNLDAYGIRTFRDDEELEKGGDIAFDLSRAIEESKIFTVIFSKNYANSRWCLNELLKIIESMEKEGKIVLPIFYHVNPSDVRKQLGSYGEAFANHEKDADEEKKASIQKWRTALSKASNLSGWHIDEQ